MHDAYRCLYLYGSSVLRYLIFVCICIYHAVHKLKVAKTVDTHTHMCTCICNVYPCIAAPDVSIHTIHEYVYVYVLFERGYLAY